MNTKLVAAVLAALSLSTASVAHAGPHRSPEAIQGHQGEAPPWSFACVTDLGPRRCGEPIWTYGNH
jgi:hypothetical protein